MMMRQAIPLPRSAGQFARPMLAISRLVARPVHSSAAQTRPHRTSSRPLPSSLLPPRTRVEARATELLNRSSGSNPPSHAEVLSLVEEGLMLGQLRSAVDFARQLAALEDSSGIHLLPIAALKRLLSVAALQQAAHIGDEVASVAFAAPDRRLDAELAELYCNLIAGLSAPDHLRAMTFIVTVGELELQVLPTYLSALVRNHGEASVRDALLAMCQATDVPPLAPSAALQALEHLLAAGSPHTDVAFVLAMRVAAGTLRDEGGLCASASEKLAGGASLATVLPSLPWRTEPEDVHELQCIAVDMCVTSLVRSARMSSALDVAEAAIASGVITGSTVGGLCRAVVIELSVVLRSAVPAVPFKKAAVTPLVTATTERLLTGLTLSAVHLTRSTVLQPALAREVIRLLVSFGRFDSAMEVFEAMFAHPRSRQVLTSHQHLNQLVTSLLRVGREEDAQRVFDCMLDGGKGSHRAPDIVTFNAFISHFAKLGDTTGARRFITLMGTRGVQPEGVTLMAISTLRAVVRNQVARGSSLSVSQSPSSPSIDSPTTIKDVESEAAELEAEAKAQVVEVSGSRETDTQDLRSTTRGMVQPLLSASGRDSIRELDFTLARLRSAAMSFDPSHVTTQELWQSYGGHKDERSSISPISAPYNRVIQGYVRCGAPSKALGAFDAMIDGGLPIGPDTVRVLLSSAAVASLVRLPSSMARDRIPVSWGGLLDDADAAAETRALSDIRRKQSEPSSQPLSEEEIRLVDLRLVPGVPHVLAQYRAALAAIASKRNAGSSGFESGPSASFLSKVGLSGIATTPRALEAAPWLTTPDGVLLASHLSLFRVWARNPKVRLQCTDDLRKHLLSGSHATSHPFSDASTDSKLFRSFVPETCGKKDAVRAATSLLADVLDLNQLEVEKEVLNLGRVDVVGHDDLVSDDDASRDERVIHEDSAEASDVDLLHMLPRLLQRLFDAGVPPDSLGTVCDTVFTWACTKIPPERSLLLLLTLYNCGVWVDSLCTTDFVGELVPTACTIDLRGHLPVSACALHLFLNQEACMGMLPVVSSENLGSNLRRASAARPNGPCRDLAFMIGRGGRDNTLVREELQRTLMKHAVPPLLSTSTRRALIVKRQKLAAWLDLEKERLKAFMGPRQA